LPEAIRAMRPALGRSARDPAEGEGFEPSSEA
jgi:hypothetical protein